MAHDVFISYSSLDKNTADAVCAHLEGQSIRCWIAPRDTAGPYAQVIEQAIDEAQILVSIFSDSANTSPEVLSELQIAHSAQKPIVPLRIHGAKPSGEAKYYLGRHHWIDALTPPRKLNSRSLSLSLNGYWA